MSHESAHLERPLPPYTLIPHRYRRRDEVARQLVTGLVRASLHDVHRRVTEKLPLHDEVFSLGVLEQLVRRLGSTRVAGGKKRGRDETASPNEKVATVDSVDRNEVARIGAHVASVGGGAGVAGARLGKR